MRHRDRCKAKTAYRDPAQAWAVLHRRRRQDAPAVEGVTVYACPFTDSGRHWHLGHAPSMRSLTEIAAEIRGMA